MTGDQQDFFKRIKARMPNGWFGSDSPILDALIGGIASAFVTVYAAYQYLLAQTRLQTSTDGWLDISAADYFGPSGLLRLQNETDAAYRTRIKINIIRERGTRAAVTKILTDLTGRAPVIVEPARPQDTGAYGGLEGVTLVGAPLIYRKDWQGTQLLYATPRTNQVRWSGDVTQSTWGKLAGGTGIAPVATTAAVGSAPDGVSAATRVVFDRGAGGTISDYSRLNLTSIATVVGQPYVEGVWVRSTDGLSTYTMQLSFNGAALTPVTVTPQWNFVTASLPSAADTTRTFRFDTQGGGGASQTADILMFGGMHIQGTAAGSYIPTTTAAATVTDYTLIGNAVTFAAPPAPSALLSWSGTYTSPTIATPTTVSGQWFGTGDGVSTAFTITRRYACALGYGVTGAYGSLRLNYQAFVTAYRPSGSGIPYVQGYGTSPGGYATPSRAAYSNIGQMTTGVTDAAIYAAIASVLPAASIAWVAISN
jgi:hypothetical protein